jgi:hypothetical protein
LDRLSGSQSRSGRGGEEKNSHPPPGIKPQNSDRPARSPALYRIIIIIIIIIIITTTTTATLLTLGYYYYYYYYY